MRINTETLGFAKRADFYLLFLTRGLRLFAYGALPVVLVLYLSGLGFSEGRIGAVLALTLAGDTAISLWLTRHADRLGRKNTLMLGAVLMCAGGAVFGLTGNFWIIVAAATIGVISPSGKEVGPFLSIEQAGLTQIVSNERRTSIFAWYNLTGSLASACGALFAGYAVGTLTDSGWEDVAAYRSVLVAYSAVGVLLLAVFSGLSRAIEVERVAEAAAPAGLLGLGESRGTVLRLAGLFAMDSFAGGFIIDSLMAYWFVIRFDADPKVLGGIFFGANLLAGLSSLAAARIARRFGLINTMVFTHLPSNVLLMLVPLMPNLGAAITMLLIRCSISQMDVPTRQSYTMAVVKPEERAAAGGVTNVTRSLGSTLSPLIGSAMMGTAAFVNWPLYIAGALKIVYDLLLYRAFKSIKPPEERANGE